MWLRLLLVGYILLRDLVSEESFYIFGEVSRGNKCLVMERRRNPTSERPLCTAYVRNLIINLSWNILIALLPGSSTLKPSPGRSPCLKAMVISCTWHRDNQSRTEVATAVWEGNTGTGTGKHGVAGQWETHVKAVRLNAAQCTPGKGESAPEPFQIWFQRLGQPKPVRTASSTHKAS